MHADPGRHRFKHADCGWLGTRCPIDSGEFLLSVSAMLYAQEAPLGQLDRVRQVATEDERRLT